MSTVIARPSIRVRHAQDGLAVGVALAVAAGAVAIGLAHGWRLGVLLLVGALLGFSLYHAAFGFTSGWRGFVTRRRGAGLRAQCLLLALAGLLLLPPIAAGSLLGQPVSGFVFPVGLSLLVGAALFGLGMQLAGGCGSGTLYTVGGGSVRMVAALAAFVAGSLLGSIHLPWWLTLPSLPPLFLPAHLGLWGTLALQTALLAALALLVRSRESKPPTATAGPAPALLRGPWPPWWGAVALAVLGLPVLWLNGHPWGITSGFAFWGAKLARAAGLPVTDWPGWHGADGYLALPVFAHDVSVSNVGIMLGALLAASLAGRFAPSLRIGRRPLAAALLGGFLMGYGARLSFGCNIGALLGGIASGSLHGWVWLPCAFAGSLLGIRLRPSFGLAD